MSEKLLYSLHISNGGGLAICSSKTALRKAVSYWMKQYPDQTLAYTAFKKNYIPEPMEWGWCYISLKAKRRALARGGGWVPSKKLWGINLVGINLLSEYSDDEAAFEKYLDRKYPK